jgi:hypothetical protein
MTRKQVRNEKCRCGSGLKFKDCCGRTSSQLYHDATESEIRKKDAETREMYLMLKSQPKHILEKFGFPNLKDLDIVKEILNYWETEEFKQAVWDIDGKPINDELMELKKNELLKSPECVKMHVELRFLILHTPFYYVLAYHIPKSFYRNPLLISAYELYSDPVPLILRTYGSPYQINKFMKTVSKR